MTFVSPPCPLDTELQVTIVGVDGTRHEIVTPCAPYALAPRSDLRGVAPWDISTRTQGPDIDGDSITNIRATGRDIIVPIIVNAGTELALDQALAGLAPILTPGLEVPCEIIYRRPDGTRRAITATYMEGADRLEILNLGLHRHQIAPARFRAHWPFWRQVETTSTEISAVFDNAYFANLDELVWVNAGDVRTWPEWEFRGPIENVQVGNLTTGQMFRMTERLVAGQTVRITTDPANRGVWLDDNLRWDTIDATQSELFALIAGVNDIYLRGIFQPAEPVGGTYTVRWDTWWETT